MYGYISIQWQREKERIDSSFDTLADKLGRSVTLVKIKKLIFFPSKYLRIFEALNPKADKGDNVSLRSGTNPLKFCFAVVSQMYLVNCMTKKIDALF